MVYSLPGCRDVPDGASLSAWEQRSMGAKVRRGKVVPRWHGQAPHVRADAEFVVKNVYLFLLHVKLCKAKPNNKVKAFMWLHAITSSLQSALQAVR